MCANMEYGVTLDYSSLKQVGRRVMKKLSGPPEFSSLGSFFDLMGEKGSEKKAENPSGLFERDRHVFAPGILGL